MELLITDWPAGVAGVALVPPFAREKVLFELVLLVWELCKALESLCSLVVVLAPFDVECLGV